ncbi:hypothetical protein [Pseudomonas asplenii]|uniref:hypothetical protein n=1 Tax=Pseudomonas asplenii TaxID=53407 RepID=UPI0012FB0392|nr:hypothetical protein [Pseudomonas fuscovaginae]
MTKPLSTQNSRQDPGALTWAVTQPTECSDLFCSQTQEKTLADGTVIFEWCHFDIMKGGILSVAVVHVVARGVRAILTH